MLMRVGWGCAMATTGCEGRWAMVWLCGLVWALFAVLRRSRCATRSSPVVLRCVRGECDKGRQDGYQLRGM